MSKLITVLFVIFATVSMVHCELKCYTCQMEGSATDQACLKNPSEVSTSSPSAVCKMKYCTIVRNEYLDPPGQIFTFFRGCTKFSTEGITEGGGFRTYTRVCTSSLCNDWDGIASHGGSGSSGGGSSGGGDSGSSGGAANGDPGYTGVIIVDGVPGTAAVTRGDLLVPLTTVALLLKFWSYEF